MDADGCGGAILGLEKRSSLYLPIPIRVLCIPHAAVKVNDLKITNKHWIDTTYGLGP